MRIAKLKLVNFRNYSNSHFDFHRNLNFLIGENGSGKTSVLEAIHYLAMTKSFRTNLDRGVVRHTESFCQIFGDFISESGYDYAVNFNYSKSDGKKIHINRTALRRLYDIVGKIPVVVLSPSSQGITEGGPSIRRNFVDRIMSQIDFKYFQDFLDYRSRMFQRNAILNSYREKRSTKYDDYIETYDELLIKSAKKIYEGRIFFQEKFSEIFKETYNKISHITGEVSIRVISNVKGDTDKFEESFRDRLKERFTYDVEQGRTTSGPHLDSVIIELYNREIRYVGSQGEHKIVLIALKIAEGKFLTIHTGENVIFLLDDLFALLDIKHCMKTVNEIIGKNQIFLTSTDMNDIRRYGFKDKKSSSKIIELPVGIS